MPLEAGARLGPYEILDLLGTGGMGEVYRARDTRLDRTVAVKVLPPEFARDADRRQRFAREARVIASLTHPHICTLYEFDTEGDIDFLVMECLEGETLAHRLTRGQLPLAETLRLAIQIAEALAAAHKHGIVHRDLKPGNIMLTGTGSSAGRTGTAQVKLLDFGLAKLRAPGAGPALASAPTASDPLTGAGTIVGTLQYMAPEQLEGREADPRTDLFAFGAIVYEMLTGQRAFEGDSQASLIAAILEHDPPPLAKRQPLTPPALERVVRKCLAKDPEARWDSAHDLSDQFRWVLEDSGSRPATRAPTQRRSWKAAAALAMIPIAAATWWLVGSEAPAPPMRTIPLTTDPGDERQPALSPDGEQVAFAWRGPQGRGPFNPYVKLVDGGDPLLLNEGADDAFAPTWSPDGREIAFIRHVVAPEGELGDGVFLVSALGGTARQVATVRGPHSFLPWTHGLSYSPQGQQLAVAHKASRTAPSGVYLLSLDTGEMTALTVPPASYELGDYYPRFSPDGLSLAFLRGRLIAQTDIHVVPAAGGESRRITTGNVNTLGFDWADGGRSLVFSSIRQSRASAAGLWHVLVSGGEPMVLEVGDQGQWPSVSRDGRRLAYANSVWNWDLWRVGGPTAPPGEQQPRPWARSTWTEWAPQYSPDGTAVAFTSGRSGNAEIWMADSEGDNPRQLTFLRRPTALAFRGWSPDGRRFAFMSTDETGAGQVYVVDAGGGISRRLLDPSWDTYSPAWSRDGRWIYFSSFRSGQREVWRVLVDGADPVQVTRSGGNQPQESPDGRYVYYSKSGPDGGLPGLWRMPRDGGDEQLVLPDSPAFDWSMLPDGIVYVKRAGGPGATIERFDFATGKITTVVSLDEPPVGVGIAASPDGRWILYVRDESTADIMLVENFR